jgi:predicted TIM-barrel fold metal-dependent hydrolase
MKVLVRLLHLILAALFITGFVACSSEQEKTDKVTPSSKNSAENRPMVEKTQKQETAKAEITNKDIEKTAKAYTQIQEITSSVQSDIQDADSPEKREKIQLEANDRISEIIKSNDLEFSTYNEVMEQVRTNGEINLKFQKKIQELL